MKKMFVDAENAIAKAYVEPKMMVVEVDVESLVADSQNNPVIPPGGGEKPDPDGLPEEDVKRYSIFDLKW